jgi:hypothetical protein
MMKNIHSADDIAVVIDVNTRYDYIEITVRQWGVMYKRFMAYVTLGMTLPGLIPYYPRYVKAYVWGTGGAAEYERLVGKLGEASTFMDSLSLAYLYVLVILILGNIGYFSTRAEEWRKWKKR